MCQSHAFKGKTIAKRYRMKIHDTQIKNGTGVKEVETEGVKRGSVWKGVVPWYIHKLQIRATNQLHLRSIEKTVIILTNESCIVNGFLRESLHIGPSTNDADIIGSRGFIIKGYMLADEHSNADTGHIETVEEGLDLRIDLRTLPVLFVF